MDNLTKYSCKSPLEWHGCYDKDSKYSKFFTPESNAHPAKMSWGLADKIFKHLKKLNLLKDDSTIIDFMAGTGRTNIMATLHGHKSIAIELEPHFCKMIHDNKAQLEKVKMKETDIEIIQADARTMSDILTDGGVGVVSPPYAKSEITVHEGTMTKDGLEKWNELRRKRGRHYDMVGVVSPPYRNSKVGKGIQPNRWEKVKDLKGFKGRKEWQTGTPSHYSDNPSNIGNLPDKPLVGVVSPPYLESLSNGLREEDREKYEELKRMGQSCGKNYSSRKDNIGNLKDTPLVGITSPPYAEAMQSEQHGIDWKKSKKDYPGRKIHAQRIAMHDRHHGERRYSSDPENIGNLSDKPLVGITSPPYESGRIATYEDTMSNTGIEKWKERDRSVGGNYSTNPDNIVNQDSYLSAMLQVYAQAYESNISPLVTVTKNPTRDGKLRRLDLDTAKLLQLAGYKIIDYHRAILFQERQQMTLDGKIKKVPKGRLSFFKRLSYQKGGEVARWEDVIFAITE